MPLKLLWTDFLASRNGVSRYWTPEKDPLQRIPGPSQEKDPASGASTLRSGDCGRLPWMASARRLLKKAPQVLWRRELAHHLDKAGVGASLAATHEAESPSPGAYSHTSSMECSGTDVLTKDGRWLWEAVLLACAAPPDGNHG